MVLVITGKPALLGIIVIINDFQYTFISVEGSQEQQCGAESSWTLNDKCVRSWSTIHCTCSLNAALATFVRKNNDASVVFCSLATIYRCISQEFSRETIYHLLNSQSCCALTLNIWEYSTQGSLKVYSLVTNIYFTWNTSSVALSIVVP